jgi:hypothetical protein
LLVVLGGIFVADRNRAHSRISAKRRYERTFNYPGGTCLDTQKPYPVPVPVHLCTNEHLGSAIASWRERKGWYEYAAAALVVLTLASAFAVSRRDAPA